ncbi:HD domain-containing protein [Variovorax saccharolyticus]|uniref:HD domain-containing protein n=1 Tax=Variovorax saccharolyticus TaxID=3053516 RepID=UPI0025789C62|nr:HD domain-containing protein [Variovorax sp. J31P216]MDM0028778.1 HD domain-containing protein [Variovorax sp. J31P216]
MPSDTLVQQLAFLREIDRLKSVIRQSPLLDGSRKENSAEHSWHLAMYGLLLREHASSGVDSERVIKMLLIHDIVEVDVGDTPLHGGSSPTMQAELEHKAACRLFGLLPEPQGSEFLELWQEFEEGDSEDARFAKALDRVQPLIANVLTGGGTWSDGRVDLIQVLEKYGPTIRRGSPVLWSACEAMVREHFARDRPPSRTGSA